MITCVTCGHANAEGQHFCSNCGNPLPAATTTGSYRPPAAPAPNPAFGYEPPTADYGYGPLEGVTRAPNRTALIGLIVGIAVLCLCCGFLLGFSIEFLFGPFTLGGAPKPTPEPTPEGGMLFLQNVLTAIVQMRILPG